MEDVDRLKERLNALRPLPADLLAHLWPAWEKEDALHVYATNAIEGSTMDLGETLAVLEDGITIGGKKLSEHFDIVHSQRAYMLMLKLAQNRVPITTAVIRNLHRVVVGADEEFAGQWRDHQVFIRGSRHAPPNAMKLSQLMEEMIVSYDASKTTEHPIATAAKLYFHLVHLHPFADGNGRTARLLSNLELIRNGFAPILIEKEDRNTYFNVLERCHMSGDPGQGDPTELIAFVGRFEEKALERYLRILEIAENIPFDQSAAQVGISPQGN